MTLDASEPNALLYAAIAYADAGLRVFPLFGIRNGRCTCTKPNCLNPGKHPNNRITSGGLYDACNDVGMIKFWWEAFPDSNIGIRTGKESGIIVVDIDGPAGEKALAEALGDLPETWHCKTGKGHHYYFRHPGFTVGNRAGLLPQVDIRGNGGYVVAPPSRHSNGTTYEWVVPPSGLPAELPAAFLSLTNKPAGERPSGAAGQIPEGQRNDTLYRRARSMKCGGLGVDAIEAALITENKTRCVPPLDEEEVQGIARRAFIQADRSDFQVDDIAESEAFNLITFRSIIEQDLPPVDWLVKDLVSVGDRVLIYGAFATYKSWLLLDLALHIAAGKSWLGTFEVPYARSVLYVDEEMNHRTLRRRIRQLSAGADLLSSDIPFQALSRAGIRFDATGAANLLNELHCRGYDPDVIIIETFRRVLVGSESDAEKLADFWRMVEPLQRAGKTLIISHHMKKPSDKGNQVRYMASGSTDIIGGAESGFAVTRDRKRKTLIEVECVKLRSAEEPPPFKAEFSADEENAGFRFDGWTKAQAADVDTQVGQALDAIVAFLEDSALSAVRARDIKMHLEPAGYSNRTVDRALIEGIVTEVLDRPKRGWYQIKEKEKGDGFATSSLI